LIEKYKSDCLQCGLDAEEKNKKPKTEVIAMPKTDVVEMKKTKDKIDLKIIEVISVREGKDVLKAIALENQIARRQDKECELLHVAVAVVQLHVMGALNTSALSSASHQHVIVKEDVKSVVQDHRWLCPLFTAQEKGDSMLLFDYTDIFCEMFVSGSDDGHGNHVEPITADQYRLRFRSLPPLRPQSPRIGFSSAPRSGALGGGAGGGTPPPQRFFRI
jgi:hypothetical protein